MARRDPRILAANTSVIAANTAALASTAGMRGKALVQAMGRWPSMVLEPPERLDVLVRFLMRLPELGFKEKVVRLYSSAQDLEFAKCVGSPIFSWLH